MRALDLDPASLGLLLDIDGVLHVGETPVEGAVAALGELRGMTAGVRLITNTTSKPRARIVERLQAMGFAIAPDDVLTPATTALEHCRERGHRSVMLLVPDDLRGDLGGLEEPSKPEDADAVVLGDLGRGFDQQILNRAFRSLIEGAELIALQHNRYWRSSEGLVLDVGAWSAALEYGAGVEATVVGKPSARFFAEALAGLDEHEGALMVGDDIEADVGGALEAGMLAVLVRTGKYRAEKVAASGVEPTATIDSIADLPALLAGR
jgi:HAD superfamily hydrolase (TIGR01458 family)